MKYIIANFKMNATEELINHFLNNLISFDEQKLTIGLAPGDLYLKTFVDLSQTKKKLNYMLKIHQLILKDLILVK